MTQHYFGGVLAAFESGAQLDLRFRLALDLMKAHAPREVRLEKANFAVGERGDLVPQTPAQYASFYLDAAEELVALAEKRGLVLGLPDDDSLNSQFKRHIRRSVRANLFQQNVTQSIATEESGPQLAHAASLPPAPNGRQ